MESTRSSKIVQIPVQRLKDHPENARIYSPTELDDLEQSIQQNGLLEPLVATKKMVVLSGHRRLAVLKRLDWKEAPVRVLEDAEDEHLQVLILIECNRTRIKTYADIVNESQFLAKYYENKLGGKGTRTDIKGGGAFSRIQLIADRLGLGLSKMKQLQSIYRYEPDLIQKIDEGDLSVNAAYQQIREKHLKPPKKKNRDFQREFRSLLKDTEPSIEEVQQVLNSTYPYSLIETGSGETKQGFEDLRDELLDNLEEKKRLDARGLMLWEKREEIVSTKVDKTACRQVRNNLWKPKNIQDKDSTLQEIQDLQLIVEPVSNKTKDDFKMLRIGVHGQAFNPSLGRLITFFIKAQDGRYLGCLVLGSDFMQLDPRDTFIGWNDEQKLSSLGHSAVVSSCVATQPFGATFLGGKAIALLALHPVVRKLWKKRYGDDLISLTTTSLFGSGVSQYSGLRVWKKCGGSQGSITIKPDEKIFLKAVKTLRKSNPEIYEELNRKSEKGLPISSPKQKMLSAIYRMFGVEGDFSANHERGVYVAQIYKNSNEFLRGEIEAGALVPDARLVDVDRYLTDWWKPKAMKRYEKLHDAGSLSEPDLWYWDLDSGDLDRWFSANGVLG